MGWSEWKNVSGGLFDDCLLMSRNNQCVVYCETPIVLATAMISGGSCDIYDITTTTNGTSQVLHDSNYVNGNSSGSWNEGSTYTKVFKDITEYGEINYSLAYGGQGTGSIKTFGFNCSEITDLGSEATVDVNDSYKYVVAIIHEQGGGATTVVPTISIDKETDLVYEDSYILGTTWPGNGYGIGAYCIKIFKDVSNSVITMDKGTGSGVRRTSYQCYGLN